VQSKGERTRDRIRAAALTLFQQRGWQIKIEDIAGGAGLGVAAVYLHYGTKQDLLGAACQPFLEEIDRRARQDVTNGLTHREAIIAHIRRLCEHPLTLVIAAAWGERLVQPRKVDILVAVPLPLLLVTLIDRGQVGEAIDGSLNAHELATYHTYALLAALAIRPNEAAKVAELTLSQLLPALGL